ncbi:MAG: sigma-70 family RNA polymerase sigma factor [Defluviitaleaceae bacterium]|nr:sigma-70 family RNA polymerase sigma factor [Defluviitaleaceae bacterium]
MEITSQEFLKALNGDIRAFENIVKTYERLVYSVALRLLRNPEDAKDATQEVFIKVYKSLDKCKNENMLKSWICVITNNTCIDIIRKHSKQSTISLDAQIETDEGAFIFEIPSDEKTPEQKLVEDEGYEMLKAAIDKLPLDYRSVLVLRDIHSLSYSEVAEATNLNMGTVKSRLARARAMLKKIYIG